MDYFKNVTYDYKNDDDVFVARGLQLNMLVDEINSIEAILPETGLVLQDLTITNWLKVDTIQENTAGAGVTIDGVLLKDGEMSIDYLGNPTQDKTISFGAHTLAWQFTNPNGGLEYNWIGAASGHLFSLSQNTGVPSAGTHMIHMDAASANVVMLHMNHDIAATRVFYTSVTGDTQGIGRFEFDTNGELSWGAGSGATDISLSRSAVGTLQVSNNLDVGNTLSAISISATDGDFGSQINVDTIYEHTTDAGVTVDSVLIKDGFIDYSYISNPPGPGGSLIKEASATVLHTDQGSNIEIIDQLPVGSVVVDVKFQLIEAFNDSGTNIIQVTGAQGQFVNDSTVLEDPLGVVQPTLSLIDTRLNSTADVYATYIWGPGDATAGEVKITVFYVTAT